MWSTARDVVRLGAGSRLAYAAAGGLGSGFLDTWGSSMFRLSELGPDWTFVKPIRVPESPATPVLPITGSGPVSAHRYSTGQYVLHGLAEAPVLHVEIDGHARLTDGSLETSDLSDTWFCTAGKCECPRGQEGAPPPARPLDPFSRLALTGKPDGEGTRGNVTAYKLSEWCREKRPPLRPGGGRGGVAAPPLACRERGCAASNGEPHLNTVDRLAYDFQAVGEFVLARSSAGGFEVQARQEPFPQSDEVSINTAIALRVGPDRVMVSGGAPLVVRVNGRLRRLLRDVPLRLRGGGRMSYLPGGQVDVAWGDGSAVRVWGIGGWGVGLAVRPAPGTPDGSRACSATSTARRRTTCGPGAGRCWTPGCSPARRARRSTCSTGVSAESWRVRRRESLFTYTRGRGPKSYVNRKFPKRHRTVASLPGRQRRAAERFCLGAGTIERDVLEGCVLDIALTGQADFARAAVVEQAVTAGASGTPGTPLPPPTPGPPGPPIPTLPPEPGPVAWTPIPAFATRSDPVALARTGDGVLHAVAARRDGERYAVEHVPIAGSGAIGVPTTIFRDSYGAPKLLVRPDGGLRVVMAAANIPPLPATAFEAIFTFDAPATGASWTQGPFVKPGGFGSPTDAVLGASGVQFTFFFNLFHRALMRDLGHGADDYGIDPTTAGCARATPPSRGTGSTCGPPGTSGAVRRTATGSPAWTRAPARRPRRRSGRPGRS